MYNCMFMYNCIIVFMYNCFLSLKVLEEATSNVVFHKILLTPLKRIHPVGG